jgi:hypothetical protein
MNAIQMLRDYGLRVFMHHYWPSFKNDVFWYACGVVVGILFF